jgi:hypothetical protein
VNYLYIEDKQALKTGRGLVVWVDERGRVVRHGRFGAEFLYNFGLLWTETSLWEIEEFVEAEFGPDYLLSGAYGGFLKGDITDASEIRGCL